MTVAELLDRMSSAEIGLWRALYLVEKEERDDAQTKRELSAEADRGISEVRSQLRGKGR